jgi:hypothetical protein
VTNSSAGREYTWDESIVALSSRYQMPHAPFA